MTDERPRYGEYATPDEQRRAAGLPAVPEPDAQGPVAVPVARIEAPKPRPVDRLLTIAMLAYGLINVLSSIPQFLDLPASLTETMKILGIPGEFTNVGPARTWGVIAIVVMAIGYAVTVLFAFRRLKAGAAAWWIPLAGFVLTMTLVSMCLAVPIMGDPAFLGAVQGG